MIVFYDKSQISEYFPNAHLFVRAARDKSGGYEFHGPCPKCGGKDRFIVSNGFFRCRICNYSGKIGGNESVDEEKIKEARVLAEKSIEKQNQKRKSIIEELTNKKPYMIFHRDLVSNPLLINDLQSQGITEQAIKKFIIGYRKKARYYYEGGNYLEWPAYTFPVFGKYNGKRACISIRQRFIDPLPEGFPRYYPYRSGVGAVIFQAVHKNSDIAFVVEGEKKAIVMWCNGLSAFGIPGIETMKEEWARKIAQKYPKVIVIPDGDEDPEKRKRILEKGARIAMKIKSYGAISGVVDLGNVKPDDAIVENKYSIIDYLVMAKIV